MDSEVYKLTTGAEPDLDLQTRMENKRAELLAACRLVAAHVAWTQDAQRRHGVPNSPRLATVAKYLSAEIEHLEYAE